MSSFHNILPFTLMLIAFGAVSFVQNMAFTWSSRSRNSGDPSYHRKASWASNGIYYITNALLTVFIVKTQVWWLLGLQGLVYAFTTAEGSVLMMKRLIASDKGKRAVGAGKNNTFTEEEANKIRKYMITGGPDSEGSFTFTDEELVNLKELAGGVPRIVEELVTESAPSEYFIPHPWQPRDVSLIPPPRPGQGAKL